MAIHRYIVVAFGFREDAETAPCGATPGTAIAEIEQYTLPVADQ